MRDLIEKKLHKDGLTLVEFVDRDGWIVRKEYRNDADELHRTNGPACVFYEYGGKRIEQEEWWQNGQHFRQGDKPVTVKYAFQDRKKVVWEEWYLSGEGFKKLVYSTSSPEAIWKKIYLDKSEKLHRDEGPAVIEYIDGEISEEIWYQHGQKHRENGPAFCQYLSSGIFLEEYYQEGKLHRDGGPAVKKYALGRLEEEIWYRQGRVHREDGPAYKKYTAERNINMFSETPENRVVVREEHYMFGEQLQNPVVDFPGTIKAIRKKRDWTVADLAEACQVSPRTVEGWEQGRVPKNFIPLINLFLLHFEKEKV